MCEFVYVSRCYFVFVGECQAVLTMYQAWQLAQTNLITSVCVRKDRILSFVENILPILYGTKTRLLMASSLHSFSTISVILLWACLEKNLHMIVWNSDPLFWSGSLYCCTDDQGHFLPLC